MSALLSGDPSNPVTSEGSYKINHEKPEESGRRWYFSRKEIEDNSPSRNDGIDLKKEAYLRKSYCTFLQDLGMRLKVPQVTIATAIIFCHRFFLRQSHAKNDRRTVATICMFLAGKVEETPRPLKDVILVSYEIIHKKDAAAVQRIKQKDVYEQQKELILLGERIVLVTLGFDLNVHHPYKPLVEAIKKFKVAQNALAQVAWNFVNDGLRTSLCLQFMPHHIAAGAIFLAAKFLKVKLPSDGDRVWWQEFDVNPRQLEEVSNQMLELYEQNRVPQSQASEAEGSGGGSHRPQSKGHANEEQVAGSSQGGAAFKSSSSSKPDQSRADNDKSNADSHSGPSRIVQPRSNDHCGSCDVSSKPNNIEDDEVNDIQRHEHESIAHLGNSEGTEDKPRSVVDGHAGDGQEGNSGQPELSAVEAKDKHHGRNLSTKVGPVSQSPQSGNKKLDPEKLSFLKAAMVRRKAQGDITRKADPTDELEIELEKVEMPGQNEKIKSDRKQNWSKLSNRSEHENSHYMKHTNDDGDRNYPAMKEQSPHVSNFDAVEEGELEQSDDVGRGYHSPKSSTRKRKSGSPSDMQRANYAHGLPKQSSHGYGDDRNVFGRHEYPERDHKRRLQENHV